MWAGVQGDPTCLNHFNQSSIRIYDTDISNHILHSPAISNVGSNNRKSSICHIRWGLWLKSTCHRNNTELMWKTFENIHFMVITACFSCFKLWPQLSPQLSWVVAEEFKIQIKLILACVLHSYVLWPCLRGFTVSLITLWWLSNGFNTFEPGINLTPSSLPTEVKNLTINGIATSYFGKLSASV